MDFAALPRWAKSSRGESRGSWLAATGRLQRMDRHDWLAWVQPSADEPERPRRGAEWVNLPNQLGNAFAIPPMWRLHPEHRLVFCPRCYVEDPEGVGRWVTRADWLDSRRLSCARHAMPLVYRPPPQPPDLGYALCMDQPEIQRLVAWLHEWCRWDGACGPWRRESLWRRDLVHLAVCNWHRHNEHPAAALAAWELHLWGWDYPKRSTAFPPGEPTRLGMLPPAERVGALLMAYRCWIALRCTGQVEVPIRLPTAAWEWFFRRWGTRALPADRAHLSEVATQCSDTGQRLAPKRAGKKVH